MYYTGIDLHQKTSFITTVDETGKVIAKVNLPNEERIILRHFQDLGDKTKVVMESMRSWYWLYDLLTDQGIEVVISNPVKTKAIASARIKNDKVDSAMLAQLLRSNLISPVYVSSRKTRELKELLRHRAKLVRDMTRLKNRIHVLLAKNNIQVPWSDLFGVRGIAYLEDIQLPQYQRRSLETYLSLSKELKAQIEPLNKEMQELAKSNPQARLLMTIPGIGSIVALFILAEIEDISRFPSHRHLASYAGLVPSLDSSAGKDRRGRITKQGSPYLRTALVEAAQVTSRVKRSRLHLFFRKRIVKSGYQRAIVATAHKILHYAYYILKHQTPYRELDPACA